eukprot:gene14630-19650_t
MKPTSAQTEKAFAEWMSQNDYLKESMSGYLSRKKFEDRFNSLVVSLGDANAAAEVVTSDPSILIFDEARVKASFSAWCEKLGSREEVLKLAVRNPPILSISTQFVDNATTADIYQTQFWSYVAVTLRPVAKLIQKGFKSLYR